MMSAAKPSPVPKRLSAYVGGYMGVSYSVELHKDTLTYTTFDDGHTNPEHATITPSAAQWSEFRRTLYDLKLWQWRNEYPNTDILDGTQWSLDIAYADHALKTHGDNSYPDAHGKPNGKPNSTKVFNRYLASVEKLTGKDFQ